MALYSINNLYSEHSTDCISLYTIEKQTNRMCTLKHYGFYIKSSGVTVRYPNPTIISNRRRSINNITLVY
jgi:hypothetical protein